MDCFMLEQNQGSLNLCSWAMVTPICLHFNQSQSLCTKGCDAALSDRSLENPLLCAQPFFSALIDCCSGKNGRFLHF